MQLATYQIKETIRPCLINMEQVGHLLGHLLIDYFIKFLILLFMENIKKM